VINHIQQPEGSNLCGQCCVAMLAGISLEKSIELVGKRGSTRPKDLARALTKLGFECDGYRVRIRGHWASEHRRNYHLQLSDIAILTVQIPGKKMWHWVLYAGGNFYDPSFRTPFWGRPAHINVSSFIPIKRKSESKTSKCDDPDSGFYGQECACAECFPIGFCVDDPCGISCDGPVKERCSPPEEDDD